jgi:hypothetical protein
MTKLFVGLGEKDDGETKTIEIIDLESAKTCKNLPDFPYATAGFGGLGFQNMPMICSKSQKNAECYSLDRNKWTSSPSPITKEGICTRAVSFSLFSSTTNKCSNAVVSLSPYPTKPYKLFLTGRKTIEVLTEKGWKELPQTSPVVNIYDHCAVLINSTTVMVIGGIQNLQFSNKTYFFNTENEIWTEGPQLKNIRKSHSCGTIRKSSQSQEFSVIVAGGDGYEIFASVEILDPGSNEWRKGPELPFGIEEAQMVEDQNGGVVLVGGRTGNYLNRKYLDTLYQLPHGGADTEWLEMEQKLETGRAYHVAFLVPDSLVDCS